MDNKIFLIGFMGSGKSTVGRKLAKALGYELIDLDKLFELKEGMSIGDYFQKHGEVTFRKRESELLQSINYPEKAVIATGGGTPCFFSNMEWMNSHGMTIYIAMEPAVLLNRLKNAKGTRPAIKNMNEDELRDFIINTLSVRQSYYAKAKLMVSGLDLTAEKLIDYLQMTN